MSHLLLGITEQKRGGFFGLFARRVYSYECECGPGLLVYANKSDALHAHNQHKLQELYNEQLRPASKIPATEKPAPPAQQKEPQTMHVNFEAIIISALGIVVSSQRAEIDNVADNAADKIVAAVKDSNTKLDDFAASEFADVLQRIAARVKAGLAPTE